MVEERGPFLLDHVHQAGDAEHVLGLGGSRAAGDDQFARPELLQVAEDGPERVRLGDTRPVLRGRPGVVGLHGHPFAAHQGLRRDAPQRLGDGLFDRVVPRDDHRCHRLVLLGHPLWTVRSGPGQTAEHKEDERKNLQNSACYGAEAF